jgi:hypothetical protein
MHVLYIELSMRLLVREVAPARPGMGALEFGIRALQYERVLQEVSDNCSCSLEPLGINSLTILSLGELLMGLTTRLFNFPRA